MKNYHPFIAGLIALSLTACNDTRPVENYIPLRDALKNTAASPAAVKNFDGSTSSNSAAPGPVTYNPPHGQPGHREDIAVGAPIPGAVPASQPVPAAVPTAVPATASAMPVTPAGMNPPHGQPGHRCDIAVGAPLDSKPAASTQPVVTTSSPAVKTAPGMNPPHGQPGHRCDIAVGAPLNSKPATTTTPTPLVTNTTPTAVAPGMNPAHGQPGHRCDIPVGSPLSQPVANAARKDTGSTTGIQPITVAQKDTTGN